MKKLKIILMFLVTLQILVSCSIIKDGAIIGAHNAFQKGDYIHSIKEIDVVLSQYDFDDNTRASLIYMKAKNLEKLNEPAQAMSLYNYLVEKYPDTESSYMARAVLQNSGL
jgi:hypothetical protein